jgi:hypothetical protein
VARIAFLAASRSVLSGAITFVVSLMSTTRSRSCSRKVDAKPIAACCAVGSLSVMLAEVSRRMARSSGTSPAAKNATS